jgi:hypothetical protein
MSSDKKALDTEKQVKNYSETFILHLDGHFRTCNDLKIKANLFKKESERAQNENRKIRLYGEYKQTYFKNMRLITENYSDILASIRGEILPPHTISSILETINRFEVFLNEGPENTDTDERETLNEHAAKLQELYGVLVP